MISLSVPDICICFRCMCFVLSIYVFLSMSYLYKIHYTFFNFFICENFTNKNKTYEVLFLNKKRGHQELNLGPIDLQSTALPLSYVPMLNIATNK